MLAFRTLSNLGQILIATQMLIAPQYRVRSCVFNSFWALFFIFQTVLTVSNHLFYNQSYGIYFGLFVTFSVLANPLLTTKFPVGYESSLGWMGFWCEMAAIFSCLLIGLLLDKYGSHQLVAVLLNFFSMCVWLAFILCLINTNHFTILYK